MQSIQWGIIGCGDVTERKSGPAFNKVPGSQLVAVMRRDAAKAADFAKRHQVPRWYQEAGSLIDDPEVNAIYIATPPSSHREYCLKALDAGKQVYLEKPMALNAGEAQEIVDAVNTTGARLTVAHYRREQPFFLKIKSLIEARAAGDTHRVELRFTRMHRQQPPGYNWRLDPTIAGGGLFHDLAPHQLDLLLYFFGTPQRIEGVSGNRGGHYEADDFVHMQMAFENGINFQGSWDFSADADEDRCICYGSRGSISFSVFDAQVIWLQHDAVTEQFNFQPPEHVQQPMIEKVVSYFQGKGSNPCSAADGCEVMRMIDIATKK